MLIAARAQAAPLLQPPPSHLGKNWGLQELPSVLCAFFYIKPHKKGTLSPVQCFQALCLCCRAGLGQGFCAHVVLGRGCHPAEGCWFFRSTTCPRFFALYLETSL